MSGWSLRDIVRDVYAERGDIDRATAISIVMNRIPQELSRTALQQAIPCFIRQAVSEGRLLSPIHPENTEKTTPGRSAKGDAIRSAWRRQLDGRYIVTDDDGRTFDRRLGEMTYDQLVQAAEERDVQAAKNAAKAEFLREVAESLVAHGVSCADELPVDVSLAAAA